MSYYYVVTNGSQKTCIKIHAKFPLPSGITANCADDLTMPSDLHFRGTASVPCDTGGSISTNVYSDNAADISNMVVSATPKKAVSKRKKKAAPKKKKIVPKKKKKTAPKKKKIVPKKKAAPKKTKKTASRPSKKVRK